MATELDPFRVIVGTIATRGEVDILLAVANSAGLRFDQTLSEKQDYSRNTRLRALVPRVLEAYDALDEVDQMVAARAALASLVGSATNVREPALEALARVGWLLQEDQLVATAHDLREMFFPKGSQWDAFVVLRDLFREAGGALTVVDAYADGTVFELLAPRESPLALRVLCTRYSMEVAAEARRFCAQFPRVTCEVRHTRDFHDRFVVVDDRACVHIGASINHAGRTAFMISRLEDDENRQVLLQAVEAAWAKGTPVQ